MPRLMPGSSRAVLTIAFLLRIEMPMRFKPTFDERVQCLDPVGAGADFQNRQSALPGCAVRVQKQACGFIERCVQNLMAVPVGLDLGPDAAPSAFCVSAVRSPLLALASRA